MDLMSAFFPGDYFPTQSEGYLSTDDTDIRGSYAFLDQAVDVRFASVHFKDGEVTTAFSVILKTLYDLLELYFLFTG